MGLTLRRHFWLISATLGLFALGPLDQTAKAQRWGATTQFSLSEVVHVDEPDSACRKHLEQVRVSLAESHWADGIETLREISQTYGPKVIRSSPCRYVSVREFCHRQVAALPADGLVEYRRRVDPDAESWYQQALVARDESLLWKVVEEAFCSSPGDDALFTLGEWALARGDFTTARDCWSRILSMAEWRRILLALTPPPSQDPRIPGFWQTVVAEQWGRTVGLVGPDDPGEEFLLAYPDSSRSPAETFARLVLVSILEGRQSRGEVELAALNTAYPGAQGTIARRNVQLSEMLRHLLEASHEWSAGRQEADWLSFAGGPARNKNASRAVDVGAVLWSQPLGDAPQPGGASPTNHGFSQRRIAEDPTVLLSYHPLVVGHLVLVNRQTEIMAWQLETGLAAFGTSEKIFEDTEPQAVNYARQSALGAPRYTMTAHNGRLYAKLGKPETSDNPEQGTMPYARSSLVCLDLAAQGRTLWMSRPDDERWAFEGAPVADDNGVYVAMRRTDVRPQSHVACFDPVSGRLRWRRMVAAAETPARGMAPEITHNLLTLVHGTLYFNTNLGAVAALDTRDGWIRWITLYDRARSRMNGDLAAAVYESGGHFYRDLNPCLFDGGKLIVAPSDCERIFALDAATGAPLWESTDAAANTVHLLGAGGGNLIASGDSLWWFNLESGKFRHVFPDGNSGPAGYGRGVLAGGYVYWPTRARLYVFDQASAELVREIDLSQRGAGVSGGNLLVADDLLLIATPTRLLALSQFARAPTQGSGGISATTP